MKIGAPVSSPISAPSACSLPSAPSSTSASNLVFPVTQTRSGAAPSARARSASSSERMRKQSIRLSGLRMARNSVRYRESSPG